MTAAAPMTQRHTHASGLHAVASALDDLHRDALRAAGAASTRVRLSVLNIVAACNDPSLVDPAIETLLTVAERHPARAIVILGNRDMPAMIESDISLRQSPQGSYVELVLLEVGGEPSLHLSSIVQPLLIPDIPVQLWLVGAPPLEQAFRPEAVSLVERIILDSDAYPDANATLQLIRTKLELYEGRLRLSDITWERLRPWREAIARAFDGPAMRRWLWLVTGLDIVCAEGDTSLQAALLEGWLASRLRWPQSGGPEVVRSDVPAHGAPGGELQHVRLRCADRRHTARVDVERRQGMLRTSIDVDAGVEATAMTLPPPESDGLLIARLMAALDEDRAYREAVTRACTGPYGE